MKLKYKKKADAEFSRYIRLKYADEVGYCTCVTCGVYLPWKKVHCGHYVSRRYTSTRYDERNCFPQCPGCNLFNEGRRPQYTLFLIKTFGENIIQDLVDKSNKITRMKDEDYKELAEMYKEKANQLIGEKEL